MSTTHQLELTTWIVIDGYCATRALKGTDPMLVENRVAFIEKTARVRVAPFTVKAADYDNWEFGPKGSGGPHTDDHEREGQYGFDPECRAWCDTRLRELGYTFDN